MSDKVYIDRTRTVAYQRCHRLGWLTTYEGGRGLQLKKLNQHLLIGTFVHLGINELLDGHDIEYVINALQLAWQTEISSREIEEGSIQDCWNLVEAQTRAFQLVALPRLLEEYEVLDTEKEEHYELAEGIVWMGRTDAVLQHRVTEDIGILSIKTTGKWDSRKAEAQKHDMQGLSEMWLVKQRGIEPLFVQYLYLLKGSKKLNELTNQWEFQSPLTKGYRKADRCNYEYAHSYWWTCKEAHPCAEGKKKALHSCDYPWGRGMCEGGKKHNLKGWEAVDIGKEYPGGIKQWISDLLGGAIQPGASSTDGILDEQFIMPAPTYRSPQEIQRWQRSTVQQQREIIQNKQMVECAEDKEKALDLYFTMYTHSCDYPSPCVMQEICYGGLQDPIGSGMYEPRRINHPIEETPNE